MTYGATTTVDSHPLARALARALEADAAHLVLVRDEYERTRADHELEDGCDQCAVGANPDRLAGWEFVAGEFLCGRCAFEAKRRAKVREEPRRTKCRKGHKMTAANTYVFIDSRNIRRDRCMDCQRKRGQEYKARLRAAKAAS